MMKFPRNLFWITVAIFVLVILIFCFLPEKQHPAIVIRTAEHPTIGNPKAPVQVVVFEEPKCKHCKNFTENIFPKIKKNYIDTDKIQFTVIPVSFLTGSMPSAIALLCVQAQNNKLFFAYLHTLYENLNPDIQPNLEKLAKKTSSKLNLAKLKVCLEKEEYRKQIEANTNYGNKIMGHLTTPSVYVDGVLVDKTSFEEISKKIEQSLKKQEVK